MVTRMYQSGSEWDFITGERACINSGVSWRVSRYHQHLGFYHKPYWGHLQHKIMFLLINLCVICSLQSLHGRHRLIFGVTTQDTICMHVSSTCIIIHWIHNISFEEVAELIFRATRWPGGFSIFYWIQTLWLQVVMQSIKGRYYGMPIVQKL